jgi:16S rRNA (cytidine1402-2'-O)-methyltransferase
MIRNNPYATKEGPLVGLVSTPIGNIEDITLRAMKFLQNADIIACEDTRNTGLLLSRLNIKPKKLISLYAQTEAKESKRILEEVQKGKLTLAYCSDAGMPGISDPGSLLVKTAYEMSIPVTILPGPTASLCALVLSSFDSADFSFYGFLPTKNNQEKTFLEELKGRKETLIFYESPKRILKTIEIMKEVFGPERKISLIRELTKIHEEVVSGTLEEFSNTTIEERGECIIIVEGNKEDVSLSDEDIIKLIKTGLKKGKTLSTLSKEIASEYKLSKNAIYKLGLTIK